MEFVVPPGDGPLELPDIHLETRAWARMLGKPAAEIEAVDLDGKPVALAEYRGKVTVLGFWSSTSAPELRLLPLLRNIQERLKGQPVAILALHDASLNSLASLKKALTPIPPGNAHNGEIPIRFLLDRSPTDSSHGTHSPHVVKDKSGRTADAYESESSLDTVVIDKNGRLVFAVVSGVWEGTTTVAIGKNGDLVRDYFEDKLGKLELLEAAVEDQLGLPRSRSSSLEPTVSEPTKTPSVLKGRVVDLDGRPIAGAKVSSFGDASVRKAPLTMSFTR